MRLINGGSGTKAFTFDLTKLPWYTKYDALKLIVLTFLAANLISSSLRGQQSDRITYQISLHHPRFEVDRDSIVISGNFPFCNRVQIFRGQQKILDHTDPGLEVIGNPSNWFTEHDNGGGEYVYIIRVFNAPEPDKFLIVKTTNIKTRVFGTTEPSTAEIFGDVDFDGKFEIGGLTGWCQSGDMRCHSEDY